MLAKRTQTFVLVALAILGTCARANPDGPTVVHGSASFAHPNANTLNVTTGTNKAIINWQGFNIGAGQTTNFIQPGRNSAVLNRVISNSPSKIYGNLNSNGKVFLINQHGLMIGAGAKINTAGFYGSTLNITNEDFLKGDLKFEGGGFGGIVNKGYIHAGPGGNVVLIAPDIENGGVIEVDDGKVLLAAGKSIRITSLNDSAIEFDVESGGDDKIINLGDIIAKQGAVRLFADSLTHSGSISADGLVQNADGTISLVARKDSDISGTLVASAGRIEIIADDIKVRSSALIDTSSLGGGGEILIGGDQQGLNPAIRNATSTTVEAGAEVHADGIENADGGRVIVFASNDVHVHGEVSARGGAQSGDGGFIETSGLEQLDITRAPDASAANGAPGEWLIDPNNITIIPDTGPQDPNDYLSPFTSTVDSTVLGSVLINSSLSNGTDVSIATGAGGAELGDINVLDAILKTGGGDTKLTLSAHNDINIDADIRSTSGRLDMVLDSDSDGVGGGEISINATLDGNGGTIDASNDTVRLNQDFAIIESDMTVDSLILQEGTLDGAGNLVVNGLTLWDPVDAGSIAQDVFLLGSGVLFANGGFDLGPNLNNDTMTLDKLLVVGANSSWSDANLADNTITGIGTIVNSGFIQASNGAQLDVNVIVSNNAELSKESGAGLLQFTGGLIMGVGSGLNIATGTTVNAGGVLLLGNAAQLGGGGTLDSSVNNFGGIIDIEDANGNPGTLTINGSLFMDPTSTLAIDIGGNAQGSEYDFLNVSGTMTLGGTLALFWENQFTAANNDTFDLIQAGSIGGSFDDIFDPAGVTTSSTLTVAGPPDIFQYVTNVVEPNIIFWNVDSSGNWNTAANWLGGVVPVAGDYAVINQDNDQIVITIDSPQSIAGMESQNNITISGAGSLTMSEDLLFTGSSLTLDVNDGTDGLIIEAGGVATIGSQLDWNNGNIAGAGRIDIYRVGSLVINAGADNLNTTMFNDTVVGSSWVGGAATGTGTLTNSGLLTLAGAFTTDLTVSNPSGGTLVKDSAGTTSFAQSFANGGVVQVTAGLLEFQVAAVHNGTFDLAAGGILRFGGGASTSVATLRGSGTIDIAAGSSLTQNGSIQPGAIGEIGILSVTGAGNFLTNGFIQIEIASNGGGSPQPGVDYDQLQVAGNIDLQGNMFLVSVNNYTVTDGDTFVPITFGSSTTNLLTISPFGSETVTPTYNATNLTLQLNLSTAVFWDDGAGTGNWFDVLNWSTDALPQLTDDVTIAGNATTITIAGAAAANSLSLASGYTLNIDGGGLDLASNSIVAGDINVNVGSLDTAGNFQIDGTLSVSGGTLTGDGNITANSAFNWTSGSILGNGLLTTNGVSTLNQAIGLALGRNWVNAGTLDWLAGNLSLNLSAALTNINVFNASAGATMTLNSGSSFDNQGDFNLLNNVTISGAGSYQQTGGQMTLNGFTLTIPAGLALNGGNLTGSGTVVGDLANSNGTLQPGGVGTTGIITVQGNYSAGSTADMEIEINDTGLVPGVDYDQLVVDGTSVTATLDGSISVSLLGADPSPGDNFRVVDVTGGGTLLGFFNAEFLPSGFDPVFIGATFADLGFGALGVFWDGDAGAANNLWNIAANWSGDSVPLITDDVVIGAFDVSIAAAANANTLSLANGGSLTVTAGTLTLASDSTLDGLLTISGGALDIGVASVTLNGGLDWTGASIISASSGVLNLPGVNTVSGAGIHELTSITVNHSGSTVFSAGSIEFNNGPGDPIFNNSGVFEFAGDVNIVDTTDGGVPGFRNLDGGTLVKSAGTGTSSIDAMPGNSNQGSVIVQTGTLDPGVASWTLDAGDSFSGSGTYVGDVVNNGGTVRPGGQGNVGTLTILGDFTNNLGMLEVEIDSAVTSDVLAVNNSLGYGNVAGSILDISYLSFVPSLAETHDVITCVGTCDQATPFGTVIQPTGVTHTVTYNATNLNLTVASVSFFWDGGGDGSTWFDLNNWSLDVLPNAGTSVVLTSGQNVIFDGGLATVASLTLDIGSSLNLASGTLTNAGLLTVNGGATLAIGGGALDNGGNANFDGAFAMSSGVATFRGNSVFNGGYTKSGGAATFTGTAAFNGSNTHGGGTTTFDNTSSFAGNTLISGGTVLFNAVGTMQNLNNTWSGGTIAGPAFDAPNLVLGVVPGDTTLAVSGAGTKTLNNITLDMNQNDINMSGSGSLLLTNGATIDNTGGRSFNHSGNGGIAGDGSGSFINNGGTFNKGAGAGTIAVDLVNDATSIVNVAAGALIIDDAEVNDPGTYNVAANGALVFAQDRNLTGTLNNAGAVAVGLGTVTTTLILPSNLNNSGALAVNNAELDLGSLSGNTLVMNSGTELGGIGIVRGNVNNIAGVVAVGGNSTLGNLEITGTYTQGPSSAVVVTVLNNGVATTSDRLIINGASQLNGGTLLTGYLDSSLGLVTSDFTPINFLGGVNGAFGRTLDAGGITLLTSLNGSLLTVLGAAPTIPENIYNDLTSFIDSIDGLSEAIASNISDAEAIVELLLDEAEAGGLICN